MRSVLQAREFAEQVVNPLRLHVPHSHLLCTVNMSHAEVARASQRSKIKSGSMNLFHWIHLACMRSAETLPIPLRSALCTLMCNAALAEATQRSASKGAAGKRMAQRRRRQRPYTDSLNPSYMHENR